MSLRQTPRGYKILQRGMLRARRRRKIPQWRISRTMRARSVLKKYPRRFQILKKYSPLISRIRKYSKNTPADFTRFENTPKIVQTWSKLTQKYSKDTPVPFAKFLNTPKILQCHLRKFKILQRYSSAICGISKYSKDAPVPSAVFLNAPMILPCNL